MSLFPVADISGFQELRFYGKSTADVSSLSKNGWELAFRNIDHWSSWLDMKAMPNTIPAVLKGVGAA